VGFLNEWLKAAVLEVQEYVKLCIEAFRGMVSQPFYYRDLIEQFEHIGWGSLTVVILTGFFTGAVLALQSGMTLDQFGARPFVGRLVSASMIKELGPVLTALMLTSRVGSGIAAELGSMIVAEQVNALRALGTDPIRKLVVPRVLAGTLMCPALTVVSDLVGVTGGWVIAVFQLRVASSVYWTSVLDGLYRQHRLPRGTAYPWRNAGRWTCDDPGRRGGVGGRAGRRLFHHPCADHAAVLR
jgi:phospholipid/cholesterol/gamma-HCH transport system permease protein